VDQNQIDQFVNEIVLLSQINHRNVVKLLGCCLEAQVPLLVYEFVPKGTLFKYIHRESSTSTIQWDTHLRIAAETANALSYLHSAASTPIIHRDVKSSNILLDDDFTAKVSDFGTSRLVPRDQKELATVVQGTLGYLDPEYLQTNQLTEKSDVYSFGVILVELLTGGDVLSFNRSENERSLAMYFLSSLKEDRLFEILENRIVEGGNEEQIKEVVELAKRCLRLKGDERPTMKEVAMELEGIRKMEALSWVNVQSNLEEAEHLLGETSHSNEYGGSSRTVVYDSMNDQVTLALGDGR
jgi:serine/threonine protein kinase